MTRKSRTTSAKIQNRWFRRTIRALIKAGAELNDAVNESLNLDLAVGNVDFSDVKDLCEALDNYDAIVESAEQLLK